MPKIVKDILDMEKNKGTFSSHAESKSLALSIGTQHSLAQSKGLAPLSANALSEVKTSGEFGESLN